MPSASTVILEYVCPLMGCLIGNCMFAAPCKSAKQAADRGSLGDLNPTPWAFMTGNTLGWVFYSFIIQNLFVFFANAPGFIISVWLNMCAVKLQYQDYRAREMLRSFVQFLETRENEELENGWHKQAVDFGTLVLQVTSQETPAPAAHEKLVVGIIVCWLVVIATIAFGNSFSLETRQLIVGVVVNCNLCFFYGAPLSTIFKVLRTRNAISIHILTMILNTANGSFWTAYGFAIADPFMWVPNGIGAMLGVVQFLLCLIFPRKPTLEEDVGEQEGEVEAVELGGSDEREDTLEEMKLSSSNSHETAGATSADKSLLATTEERPNLGNVDNASDPA